GYVVATLVVAFIAWIAWAYWAQIHPKVTSGETNYSLNVQGSLKKGDLASSVTFQVIRANKNVKVNCVVTALASDHSTVGTLSGDPFAMQPPAAKYPANPSATNVTVTWFVPTYRTAFAINWVGCTAPGQNSPK